MTEKACARPPWRTVEIYSCVLPNTLPYCLCYNSSLFCVCFFVFLFACFRFSICRKRAKFISKYHPQMRIVSIAPRGRYGVNLQMKNEPEVDLTCSRWNSLLSRLASQSQTSDSYQPKIFVIVSLHYGSRFQQTLAICLDYNYNFPIKYIQALKLFHLWITKFF